MNNIAEQKLMIGANTLFPVYMKLEEMKVLLVGAGNVGLEKLKAIKQNAPQTHVCVVAKDVREQFADYASSCQHVELIKGDYSDVFLKNADVIFTAVNDHLLSAQIFTDAKKHGKLCNSADKPDLCHFYLSSVVTKGDVKIAISTNGKSPTMAKRLREILQNALPNQLDDVVQNMHVIRSRLTGNFEHKVQRLNELTRVLVEDKKSSVHLWKRAFYGILFALFFMVFGYAIFTQFLPHHWVSNFQNAVKEADQQWIITMFMTGFIAQLVDGMLGMGFGLISTTVLLAAGVNPAIVSSRVHSTRVFSSGLSGYSHHKLGNVDKQLFKSLVLPGCIGSIMGASLACFAGNKNAYWIRPLVSVYTLYLGARILAKTFHKSKEKEKNTHTGLLATAGGMLDAFAGGGWGSLVTSTLMSKTKNPRSVIGAVCLAEFFVMFASALTFFILLEHMPIQDVGAMIVGGLIAAPLSARLAGKLPHHYLYLLIGSVVIFSSSWIIYKAMISIVF